MWFPDQGLNRDCLPWEHRALSCWTPREVPEAVLIALGSVRVKDLQSSMMINACSSFLVSVALRPLCAVMFVHHRSRALASRAVGQRPSFAVLPRPCAWHGLCTPGDLTRRGTHTWLSRCVCTDCLAPNFSALYTGLPAQLFCLGDFPHISFCQINLITPMLKSPVDSKHSHDDLPASSGSGPVALATPGLQSPGLARPRPGHPASAPSGPSGCPGLTVPAAGAPRANVYFPWRRKWQPTPVSLPENPMERGAWRATVHGVARVGHA